MKTPTTIPELLANAASRHGERPALVMEDTTLTYAQLEAAANRLARSLVRYGVRPGDRVAMWMPKSIEAIVSLWGIMRAGAAFVAIDPMAPNSRFETIARDCGIAGLITVPNRAERVQDCFRADPLMRAVWFVGFPGDAPRIGSLPAVAWSETGAESPEPPPVTVRGEDLATVQYTSGSTGAPKGVMVPHRALVGQTEWGRMSMGLVPKDRILGFTPLHSTMSNFDIFTSAGSGAATYPVPPRLAPFPVALARSWSEQRLTVWYLVPSAFIGLLNQADLGSIDLSALRIVGFAGETFPLERLRELMRLIPHARFFQRYGRTEIKVSATHEVKPHAEEVDTRRIGALPPDCRLHVLDDNQRPVFSDAIGELWVSGPFLMRGYWNLPAMTAEVMRTIEAGRGQRVLACRTGDLVRRRGDGILELIGRADQQVKIRGYRVETGEVEAALYRHPAVEQAVVVAVADEAAGNRLKAVVVLKRGGAADEQVLKSHCAGILPRYMVPGRIEFRDSIPLMNNGKVDRMALLGANESRFAGK